MGSFDKRDRFATSIFTFRATKNGAVLIWWSDRLVTTVRGDAARRLLAKVTNAGHLETQLALAKATGHFTHGNERHDSD